MAGIGDFLGQMFSGLAGGQDGVHTQIWRDLKPWIVNLGQSATRKWLPRINSGELCSVPVLHRGKVAGDCENLGITMCVICKRPACLQHAHIDQYADAVCYRCVGDAAEVVPALQRERARAEGRPPPPPRSQQAPPPQPKPGPTPEQIMAALRILKLKPGATMEEVRSAHRKLSALNHPDRKRTVKEKTAAEARFKEVQGAFEILKLVMGEKTA